MEGRLGEDRAQIISNAIQNDNFAVGSDGWLDSHHVTKDEYEAFLEYAVRLAKMYDWREVNSEVGSVEVGLTFTSHSGKVGSEEEKWTVFAPQTDTARIMRVAETGRVTAVLTPEQMPLLLDEGMGVFDMETGEVIRG